MKLEDAVFFIQIMVASSSIVVYHVVFDSECISCQIWQPAESVHIMHIALLIHIAVKIHQMT